MSKDKIADYDGTTAGNNTDIGGISIAEGMLPSAVNNSMRELTKQLGAFANGTDAIDALDVTGAATVGGAFTSPGIDDNADATAITIDSSENVMIGTTDTVPSNNGASGDAGVAISPDGVLRAARSGNVSLDLNRMDSNGQIAAFRANGSTVGSIGTDNFSQFFIGEGTTTGFRFDHSNNRIMAGATGSSDNLTDLGAATSRFKDLYLGGGAYLGGTGSANHLDDYEEGTFNPIFQQGISVTSYSAQNGRYTKVGRLVTAEIDLDVNVGSTNTSHVYIGGLPFTSLSGAPYGVGSISYNGGWYNANFSFLVLANTTFLAAYRQSDGGAVGGNDLTGFNGTIRLTAIYTAA